MTIEKLLGGLATAARMSGVLRHQEEKLPERFFGYSDQVDVYQTLKTDEIGNFADERWVAISCEADSGKTHPYREGSPDRMGYTGSTTPEGFDVIVRFDTHDTYTELYDRNIQIRFQCNDADKTCKLTASGFGQWSDKRYEWPDFMYPTEFAKIIASGLRCVGAQGDRSAAILASKLSTYKIEAVTREEAREPAVATKDLATNGVATKSETLVRTGR